MHISRLPALGAAAGVVVGVVVATLLITGGNFDGRLTPIVEPDASEPFIAAFQRSLEGTYAVEADFTRTLPDGRQLKSRTFVAQRPPDSIRRQFGGISGTVAGQVVSCSAEQGATFHCAPTSPAPDPGPVLQQEMTNLRSYFAPPALYGATRAGPDCFKLTQLRPSAVVPYGSQARFCFDEATGAIRVLTERLVGATDSFEATLVRGDVTAADFSLTPSDDYGSLTDDLTNSGDTGTVPSPSVPAGPPGGVTPSSNP